MVRFPRRRLKKFLKKLLDYKYIATMRPGEVIGLIIADCVYFIFLISSDYRFAFSLLTIFKGQKKLRFWAIKYIRKDFDPLTIFFESIDAIEEAY
jgi:hypothetical protein